MKSRASPESHAIGIAATIQRLGVLLAAGTAPAAAWGYLAVDGLPKRVADESESGIPIPQAVVTACERLAPVDAALWRAVATAWAVAVDAGAPLAPTLIELAGCVRDLAQTERDIAVALASPTATARLVVALPGVGLLFGTLLGFNTLGTLLTTPVGWTCVVVGGVLMLTANRWMQRMVRSAQPVDLTPGLRLDLLAIAVSGGGALDRARTSVASAIETYGDRADASDLAAADEAAVDSVLTLSQRAGVPAAALLRAEAAERRRAARALAASRAQKLSVRLMIPLGLCILPAFMLLSVVPLVAAVLASTTVAS